MSAEEQSWLTAQQGKTYTVGFDPFAGMDSFEFRGKRVGLLHSLLADVRGQLGLNVVPAQVKGWDDAYSRFVAGHIDILYGANVTPERERIMRFTRPVWKYPYTVFARNDTAVQTLGDLDAKRVGFIRNDYVIGQLPKEFPNIRVQAVEFDEQGQGLAALESGKLDGFVTAGGGLEYEFLYTHPKLVLVAELRAITSDMTMAVAKDQQILAGLLDRYIAQREASIRDMKGSAQRLYNRKILRLSEAELLWLENSASAVVGVAEDYLPFDHFYRGEYRGIAGEMLKRIGDTVGIRFEVVSAPFADIMQKATQGGVDVVNMAKTEDRQKDFLFPHAISTERDIIVGMKSSAPVQDVYGLDGRKVAVIDGFWHEEYLRKNLKNPHIVRTADIMESLRLVRNGDVDYMIENPTVVEFYINGLGYTDVVKRGNTSKDSFVYFGVSRRQPELAAIMDKVIPLIRFEDAKYAGIQSVPALRNEANRRLIVIVVVLVLALVGILALVIKVVRNLAEQKARTQFLTEREHFLYTDTLTGFHNRNYFSHKAGHGIASHYPQAVVVADLNNLKRVNDSCGHAAGDALLVLFAALVRQQWPGGHFFRMGGDEFLIVLPGVDEARVQTELDHLRQLCQQTSLPDAPGEWAQPSAAMGYAMRASEEVSVDLCIAEADQRMYRAKASMKKRRTDVDADSLAAPI
ncbi:diguanylate cyclase domain-containing protein [Rhodoferax aquaticus]|uniref:Transporter substrate-binding domain-containing protein n=1 Tax=Rhodoferax aquaticus TaxID=2527691 RepID=A0A515EUX2_9BURK|nr:transporter substrate-binding domain-containing protein [Rhodoferax aquaticus]QDL56482.1 transporter substrate-binding domain-containing protein [Rhodoferax aquaticus]